MDKRRISLSVDNNLIKRLKEDSIASENNNNDIPYIPDSIQPWVPQMNTSLPTIPAPTSKTLHGQTAEVFTCQFSPSGLHIASAGADKGIYLWNTHGDSNNCGIIRGHIRQIHELHWSRDAHTVFTASADKTCGMFDVQTGERIKCFKGHLSAVNSCSISRGTGDCILASGSDDAFIKMWDIRSDSPVNSFDFQAPITAVNFSDSRDLIFAGGKNNQIFAWEIRMNRVLYSLAGHMKSITGICLSPDETQLLSSSLDNTVRIWNVSPSNTFVNDCLQTTLQGTAAMMPSLGTHLSRPKWSKDGSMIGVGTGNGEVMIWSRYADDITSIRLEHLASVNDVDFHPMEPIVVSCSSDKRLVIDEIKLWRGE